MTWANISKQLTRLILLLVLPCMPCLAEQSDKDAKASPAVVVDHEDESKALAEKEKKSRRPRLKYRNGPVCMCNEGLSEADIQAAWEKAILENK